MAFLRRFAVWRNKEKHTDKNNYSGKDYDATFATPMAVLKLVGLRLTHNDPVIVRFLWNVFYWFEFVNLFVVTFLELINMAQTARGGSFQDAIEIFRMMPCVGYLLLAMAKSYKIVYYRPVYENLVSELRDMWPRGVVSDDEHAVMKTALSQLNIVVQGYYWCNNALLVIFLSPPFVEILKRVAGHDVPLILPFFYWFPFDPFQKGYYEVILAFQTWHGLITIWFMLSGDLLFCIFLSHVTTQFDLLALRVRRLVLVPRDKQLVSSYPLVYYALADSVINYGLSVYGRTFKTYLEEIRKIEKEWNDDAQRLTGATDDEAWEKAHLKELARIIDRHRALIRLSGDVEELFSFALLVNFFNSSIIICFCGFCCVIVEKWNEMVYKSFLTTALSQTWLLCWYGQRLLESSEGITDALYNCGWYKASQKVKSSILIMIHRAQKEVHVTTYGFSVVCLASYTTIIKTSWSYFTLLLNIYEK